MRRFVCWLVLWLTCAATAMAAPPGRRIALVMGNGGYRSVERLNNPINDARLVAETLRRLGFTLVGDGAQVDLDKTGMDRAIQAFGRALPGAEVALFYYSGHGFQVQGVNWLVPVDANPTRPQDLDFQMVDADIVLRQMDGAGTKLNILILDACRNNPFTVRGLRATGGGLAEMRAPEGTLISYATQPGNVARDGEGANSPFTAALVESMRQPGQDIFRTFNQVGLRVKRETGGAQQPWVSNSPIDGDFTFAGPAAPPPPPTPPAEATTANPVVRDDQREPRPAPDETRVAGLLPSPTPPTPAPPSPIVSPPPVPSASPAPEEAMRALIAAAPCSLLTLTAANGQLRLSGQALPGRDHEAILTRLRGLAQGQPIAVEVEPLPRFACRTVEALAPLVRRNRASSSPLSLQPVRRTLAHGERPESVLSGAVGEVHVALLGPGGLVHHLIRSVGASTVSADPPRAEGEWLMIALIPSGKSSLGARPRTERAEAWLAALKDLSRDSEARAEIALFTVQRAVATPAVVAAPARPVAPVATRPPVARPVAAPPVRPVARAAPRSGRCGDLLHRLQLGEPLSAGERGALAGC